MSGPGRVRRRRLGRTGLEVPEIGFGCGTGAGLMIGGTRAAQRAAVARALDAGIDFFDTAPLYGNTASETNLGAVLAELGVTPLIATKVVLDSADLDDIAGAVRRSVLASLGRLRVARLPLVHLHNRVGLARAARADIGSAPLLSVDDVLGPNGVLDGLTWLRERGLVDHFGCCAFGGQTAALEQLVDSDAFAALLLAHSLLNPSGFQGVAPGSVERDDGLIGARAAARGMGIVALRVLEAGRLTSSAWRGRPDASPIARRMDERARFWCHGIEAAGGDPATAALQAALAEPRIGIALVGIGDAAQIDVAVRALT